MELKAHNINLWVYAADEQEAKNLQQALDKFVMDKYNNKVYIRAKALQNVLERYGNNPFIDNFIK